MSYDVLKKAGIVIFISIFMTILVAVESLYLVPWSPYFLIYAALAIIIPFITKSYKFGKFIDIFRGRKLRIFIITFASALILSVVLDYIYFSILSILGLKGDPFFDLNAALENLASVAGEKFGISTLDAMLIYAIYVVIWAPIGEELFYRGYIYGELKEKYGFAVSMLISSFFFGIRHSTHFLLLLPLFPTVSAIYWAVSTFFFGIIMIYAYEKSDSLYTPMLIHFLANVISIMLQF